jgi:hypothetical protein
MYFTKEDEEKAIEYFLSFDDTSVVKSYLKIVSAKKSKYIPGEAEKFYLVDELHNTKEVFTNKKLAAIALNQIKTAESGLMIYNTLLERNRVYIYIFVNKSILFK